jgi:tetratricopeptide (TPR) repeat protein
MMWQKSRAADEEGLSPAFPAAELTRNPFIQAWLPGLLLVVITFIAYGPIWHAGFIWDDDKFLTDNAVVKSADGLYRLWFTASTPDYYPLTFSMLWVEWRIWGSHPLGYHLVNVLLHALSAVMVWRVLQRLNIPGALLAAAIFALHPVNVESAAWISEGKNTLAMFCYGVTLLLWLEFEDTRRWRWYAAAVAAFALALFAKTAVAPLPVVLLCMAWWRRGRVGWRDVGRSVPFFVVSGAISCVTVWFHYHRAIGNEIVRSDSFWSRLAGAGRAIWFYLYKAVLPLKLIFIYPRWQIDARSALSYVPLLLLAAVFVLCWRYWRGWGRAVFFALAYFVVMLLPILGFLNIYFMRYSLVADHWQYFAIIGPIALAGAVIRKPVVAAALLIILGALTWRQCEMYANIETLWRATIRLNPGCAMAHGNLGNELAEKGHLDEAVVQIQKALEINPDDPEMHRNLAIAFSKQGRMDDAIAQYQKTLELQPNDEEAHVNLGTAFYRLGRTDEAISQFQTALEIQPDSAEAYNNLGNCFLHLGRLDDAIAQYEKAISLKPDLAEAENNLGACLYHQGKMDEAIAHYQRAVEIQPDYANGHANLSQALLRKGDFGGAIEQLQQALQFKPDDPGIQSNLAWLLATCPQASLRDGNLALQLAMAANDRAGNNPLYLHTLAAAYAEVGRFPDAIQNVQKAIELARTAGQQGLVSHLNEELERYQKGLPLH